MVQTPGSKFHTRLTPASLVSVAFIQTFILQKPNQTCVSNNSTIVNQQEQRSIKALMTHSRDFTTDISDSRCGCSAHSSPSRSTPLRSCSRGIFCSVITSETKRLEHICIRVNFLIPTTFHLMMLSSICIRDVAAHSLLRSASPMLLEVMFNKLPLGTEISVEIT